MEDACNTVSHAKGNDALGPNASGSDGTPRLGILLGCLLPPSIRLPPKTLSFPGVIPPVYLTFLVNKRLRKLASVIPA